MEAIVEILVEAYRENVAAAVAEHGDNITEEQRAVITDRFIHNFKTNLEVGLAAVFGNVEEKKPVTEVGVEDLLRKGETSFIFNPTIHLQLVVLPHFISYPKEIVRRRSHHYVRKNMNLHFTLDYFFYATEYEYEYVYMKVSL